MWPRLAILGGLLAGVAAAALIIGGILTFAPESVPPTTPAPTVVPTATPAPTLPPPTPSPEPSEPSAPPSSTPTVAPTPVGGEGRLLPAEPAGSADGPDPAGPGARPARAA